MSQNCARHIKAEDEIESSRLRKLSGRPETVGNPIALPVLAPNIEHKAVANILRLNFAQSRVVSTTYMRELEASLISASQSSTVYG